VIAAFTVGWDLGEAQAAEDADGRKKMNAEGNTRVLIAGGGVAALEAAIALRDLAGDRVDVELLAPEAHFWYRPMSVAAPFALGDVARLELDGIARELGASFTLGALTGIDAWRHRAYTSMNTEIEYDALLVACGALPMPAVDGALTFRGPADIEVVQHVLADLERDEIASVAFVVPWGAVWSLPAYELALLTAAHLEEQGPRRATVSLLTPELQPLQLYGQPAGEAIGDLFETRDIRLYTDVHATAFKDGHLHLLPDGVFEVDRVVALPRLVGQPLDGLPQTLDGFIPVDAHGQVEGIADVYAAGDITSFRVKHGGIATQQALAAAQTIAANTGADVEPERFRPVVHGLLLTGREPRFLRRELGGRAAQQRPVASYEPLWWPPAKIVGRYLAPFLASLQGEAVEPESAAAPTGAVAVEVTLEPETVARLATSRLTVDRDALGDEVGVAELMSSDVVVVAPEDTLGEVAEHLLARNLSAAVVAEYGRVIGILTKRDLVSAFAARAHPSEARARQWMTAEPVTLDRDAPATEAALLMREYEIHHLPIVEEGRAVGMVHLDDVRAVAVLPIGLGF
jgi:sulfide:quinone oxidoreductase